MIHIRECNPKLSHTGNGPIPESIQQRQHLRFEDLCLKILVRRMKCGRDVVPDQHAPWDPRVPSQHRACTETPTQSTPYKSCACTWNWILSRVEYVKEDLPDFFIWISWVSAQEAGLSPEFIPENFQTPHLASESVHFEPCYKLLFLLELTSVSCAYQLVFFQTCEDLTTYRKLNLGTSAPLCCRRIVQSKQHALTLTSSSVRPAACPATPSWCADSRQGCTWHSQSPAIRWSKSA